MRFWFAGPRIFGITPGISFRADNLFRPEPKPPSGKVTGGFIYVIRGDHGQVKVGISANPLVRISSLQVGSPHKLEIAWVAALTDFGVALEKAVKTALRRYLVRGEWYDCPEEVAVAAIAGCAHQRGDKMMAVEPRAIPKIIKAAMQMH